MMKTFRWISLIVLLAVSVSAGMRVWTGEDGVKFIGEFNRELLGRIQVRDTAGELHLISLDKLSPADLLYIQTTISPEVGITVRKTDRLRPFMEWSIAGDRTMLYTFTVTLKKKSRMDSKAKLTVELYVIGEEVRGDNWVLVDRDVSKFVFPEGKDSQYDFVAKDIPCRKYEASWANDGLGDLQRGVTYLGYIAVVLDPKGKIIDEDTNLGNEKWMEGGTSAAVEKLRELYMQGRGSQFSRHFDVNIRKARVPQLPWYKRTKSWP